jgi:urease accessory protein
MGPGAVLVRCDAFVSNHVANRASRAQGNALSASAERSFEREALRALRKLIRDEGLPGHLPPVFGAVTLCLKLQLGEAIRLFVFTQMRGMVNAAVRLGIVGPLEAQAIQYRLGPLAEQTATQASQSGLDDLAQTAPLLDLLQGMQDRLYSRLFQS